MYFLDGSLLSRHFLSFDLQCAPAQLTAAASLFARHPHTRVVVDHMGKPRNLRADGGEADLAELETWRQGMDALASLPHVHVKLSMLGYALPGWSESSDKGVKKHTHTHTLSPCFFLPHATLAIVCLMCHTFTVFLAFSPSKE